MSVLVIQLPPRPRLRAQAGDQPAEASAAPVAALEYAYTSDGLALDRQGEAALAELPEADRVVLVVAAADLSWHRVTLPKVAMARMPAALAGMLEEGLLTDAEHTHFALEPLAKPGAPSWVAACDRAWLRFWLDRLEQAGREVDRVVPAVWPDDPPCGYFHERDPLLGGGDEADLTWSSLEGVGTWPLHGGMARRMLPDPLPAQARWFATPAVAAPAERWLGATVLVQTPGERLVQVALSMWELRQFALAPRHQGLRRLSDVWRQWMSREWQPARIGLAALLLLQLVGLNAWGWRLHHLIEARRAAEVSVLQTTYPQVRAVLNAPLQMERENETLRVLAGQPASTDMESLLQAAALGWPPGAVVQSLSYDGSSVTLQVQGWSEAQTQQLQQALQLQHLQVDEQGGRLVISRAHDLPGAGAEAASAPGV
jgi:general secretion pathway protein L